MTRRAPHRPIILALAGLTLVGIVASSQLRPPARAGSTEERVTRIELGPLPAEQGERTAIVRLTALLAEGKGVGAVAVGWEEVHPSGNRYPQRLVYRRRERTLSHDTGQGEFRYDGVRLAMLRSLAHEAESRPVTTEQLITYGCRRTFSR